MILNADHRPSLTCDMISGKDNLDPYHIRAIICVKYQPNSRVATSSWSVGGSIKTIFKCVAKCDWVISSKLIP